MADVVQRIYYTTTVRNPIFLGQQQFGKPRPAFCTDIMKRSLSKPPRGATAGGGEGKRQYFPVVSSFRPFRFITKKKRGSSSSSTILPVAEILTHTSSIAHHDRNQRSQSPSFPAGERISHHPAADVASPELSTNTTMMTKYSSYWSIFHLDHDIYKEYLHHRRNDPTALFAFIAFMCSFVLPVVATRANWASIESWSAFWWSSLPVAIISSVAVVVYFIGLVGLYCGQRGISFPKKWLAFAERWENITPNVQVVFGTLAVAIDLIAAVQQGACPPGVSIWESQSCDSVAIANSIPQEVVMFLYIYPLFGMAVIRGVDFSAIILTHVIGMVAVAYCFSVVHGSAGVYMVYYGLILLAANITFERSFRMHFFQSRAEKERDHELLALKEKHQKDQAETQMHQLRSLMGNVAHDLKTPVACFKGDLVTLAEAVKGNSIATTVIRNLEGMVNFMLLAINRSQDYVKATSNIALVPQISSFSIADALILAFNCVNNVQSNRLLTMQPLSDGAWRYILSDQQWLTENTMCLLSNAVKYSPKGARIDLKASLVLHEGALTDPADAVHAPFAPIPDKTSHASDASSSRTDGEGVGIAEAGLNRSLLIEVADTGIGVRDEEKSNLFKQFQNVQRMAGGVGLGLFSLGNRIDALNGTYGVRDRDDGQRGSIFWFSFPYRPDPMAASRADDASSQASSRSFAASPLTYCPPRTSLPVRLPSTLSSLAPSRRDSSSALLELDAAASDASPVKKAQRLLLVDDTPSILKMSTRVFSRAGYSVETAENGAEALDVLMNEYRLQAHVLAAKVARAAGEGGAEEEVVVPFSVVVCDLQMPVMDGFEFVKRYRRFELEQVQLLLETGDSLAAAPPSLLIVASSANDNQELREAALSCGMDGFVPKPCMPKDIEKIVDQLTRGVVA